jgi:hypothetical protein
MKKIIISIAALAAISSAALAAGNRSWDLRDADTYVGKYSSQIDQTSNTVNTFAVEDNASPSTNFERLLQNQAKNELSNH